MNPARPLVRPLAVGAAFSLAATALLTGPAVAGAEPGETSTPTSQLTGSGPFIVSPFTVTTDDGSTTFSGTIENTTDDWSDCQVDVVDTTTAAAVEEAYTSLSAGDEIADIYPEHGRYLGYERVFPEAGDTATWSLTSVGLDGGFEPGVIVWCWAGAEAGTDFFYFLHGSGLEPVPYPAPGQLSDPDPDSSPGTGSLGS